MTELVSRKVSTSAQKGTSQPGTIIQIQRALRRDLIIMRSRVVILLTPSGSHPTLPDTRLFDEETFRPKHHPLHDDHRIGINTSYV